MTECLNYWILSDKTIIFSSKPMRSGFYLHLSSMSPDIDTLTPPCTCSRLSSRVEPLRGHQLWRGIDGTRARVLTPSNQMYWENSTWKNPQLDSCFTTDGVGAGVSTGPLALSYLWSLEPRQVVLVLLAHTQLPSIEPCHCPGKSRQHAACINATNGMCSCSGEWPIKCNQCGHG